MRFRIVEYNNGEYAVQEKRHAGVMGSIWYNTFGRYKTKKEAQDFIDANTIKRVINNA